VQKINYLCIDDEPKSTSQPLLDPLKAKQKRLDFSYEEPTEFSKLLRDVQKKNPDGIILDIRLDERANTSGERVDFRGLAVAQELRTRMTEGVIASIPIVLWSVVRKFTRSYDSDLTSHDLFDAVYDKERHLTENAAGVATQLVDLHDGYVRIGKPSKDREAVFTLLGLRTEEEGSVDPRFGQFDLDPKKVPAHDIVGHILGRLIVPAGPLISEAYLAARLGVDMANSSDWTKLLKKLDNDVRYSGIFSEGWPRWWAHRLLGWWEGLAGKPGRLQKLGAAERVDFLRKKTHLQNLKPAEPIDETSVSTFWTICQVLNRPLDPTDGLRVKVATNLPFHEPQYASIAAVLSRKHIQLGLEVDPLELQRLDRIKHAKKAKAK
jgi:hypothetical protein